MANASQEGRSPTVVSLQIPSDAVEGDELCFVVAGKELSIAVPPSSQPGDILQIRIGTIPPSAKNDSEIDATAIPLATGKTLHVDSSSLHNQGRSDAGLSDGTYCTFVCGLPRDLP